MATAMNKNLKTVLIVEDNELIRTLLKLFLAGLPVKLWEEKDGHGALFLSRQILPHLIITDLTMPRMDGIQLTQALRAEPDPKLAKVPIIALTGTSEIVQDTAYQVGVNMVLVKPVARKALLQAIEQFLPM